MVSAPSRRGYAAPRCRFGIGARATRRTKRPEVRNARLRCGPDLLQPELRHLRNQGWPLPADRLPGAPELI